MSRVQGARRNQEVICWIVSRWNKPAGAVVEAAWIQSEFSFDGFLGQTGLDALNIRLVHLFDFSTMVEAGNYKQGAGAMQAPVFAPS